MVSPEQCVGLHPAGLRHQPGKHMTTLCVSCAGSGGDGRGSRHPSGMPANASGSRTSLCPRRALLRHNVRECSSRRAHVLPVSAANFTRRSWSAPVTCQNCPRLHDLWRRRPDGALSCQCLGAEDPHPISHPLGGKTEQFGAATSPLLEAIVETQLSPELVPPRGGQVSSRKRRSVLTSCRTSTSIISAGSAIGRARWPSSPTTRGATAPRATGQTCCRCERRHQYDLATICKWLEVFLKRFFESSQFKRSALPNAPKVGSGGSLSPRGDWRAPATPRPMPGSRSLD